MRHTNIVRLPTITFIFYKICDQLIQFYSVFLTYVTFPDHPYHSIPKHTCTFFFFLNDPATPEIYPLPQHDAFPIWLPLPRTALNREKIVRKSGSAIGATHTSFPEKTSAAALPKP